jgi:hypothetical protein
VNAPERIRAFLTARAEQQARKGTQTNVISFRIADNGDVAHLTEADLEATLQTLHILTDVLGTHAVQNPPSIPAGPAQLRTPSELADAEQGTVILSRQGMLFQKLTHARWFTPGSAIGRDAKDIGLPARVLS